MDHKFKIFNTTTVPGYKQILAEVNESEPSVKFSYNQKLYKRKLYYPNTYTMGFYFKNEYYSTTR